jgi:hypothetical protein
MITNWDLHPNDFETRPNDNYGTTSSLTGGASG